MLGVQDSPPRKSSREGFYGKNRKQRKLREASRERGALREKTSLQFPYERSFRGKNKARERSFTEEDAFRLVLFFSFFFFFEQTRLVFFVLKFRLAEGASGT